MKKYMAVLAALVIGLSSSSLEMTAIAAQMEDEQDPGSELSGIEEEQREADENGASDSDSDTSELTSLLIPEKLGVVLDPWELDGNTQIYSEEYSIQNIGETKGTLVLSFACKPQENSGVIIKAENEGLHDDESKSLYMKMVFGNGDELILSEEVSEYKVEMEPGEELSVCFQGELNENTAEPWDNGDIEVEGVYFWSAEGEAPVNKEEEKIDDTPLDASIEKENIEPTMSEEGLSDSNLLEEGKEKIQQEETEKQEANEEEEELKDKEVQEDEKSSDGEELQDKKDSLESDIDQEDSREIVDLNEPQEWKVVLNSWEQSENEEVVFERYLLQNSGETVGRLILSTITWKDQKDNNKDSDMIGQEGILCDSNSNQKLPPVYVYMALGNEEKVALYQESASYEVEVMPGEELFVDFVGEKSQMSEWEDSVMEMTITYSWNMD